MSLTPFLHFPTFFYKLRYDFRTIKGCHKIEAIRMRPQAFRNFQGDLNASPLGLFPAHLRRKPVDVGRGNLNSWNLPGGPIPPWDSPHLD